VRESRTPGSVRAKAEWGSYSTTTRSGSRGFVDLQQQASVMGMILTREGLRRGRKIVALVLGRRFNSLKSCIR
jgi:hypothetical protein